MLKLTAIALLCFGWYGGGPIKTKTATRPPKVSTTATYRHYRGLNELKIKEPQRTRTYRWQGPPNHGWLRNPYVK
jgi:hypothetical protein